MLVTALIVIGTASILAYELWSQRGYDQANLGLPSDLLLSVELNASSVQSGHAVGFTASVANTLGRVVNVTVGHQYHVYGLVEEWGCNGPASDFCGCNQGSLHG